MGAVGVEQAPTVADDEGVWASGPITDAELTALALAADPAQPPDADAVPLDVYLGQTAGLLPDWYMPPARTRRIPRVPQMIVLVLIGAFLLIEAFGLCSTYGQLPLP